jgi:hypothetical protein
MADTVQGTSIEDIELGQVENTADEQKMQEILADMNMEQEQPMQPMQAMPPMRQQMHPMPRRGPVVGMTQEEYFHEMEEEPEPERPRYKVAKKVKRNKWSLSIESLVEPLLVGLLVCLLSLPALHTFASKHATWAYKMGGELSWSGLFVVSALGAVLFGLFRTANEYLSRH